MVTISGRIADASGRALSGVTVQVQGSTEALGKTRGDGSYSVSASNCAAKVGSWSIRASLEGCEFLPAIVNLKSLTDITTVNFMASGACSGRAHALDPGPRPGPPGAGGPVIADGPKTVQQASASVACIPGLAAPMRILCEQAFVRFQEVDSVSGTIVGEDGAGLGPTFNGNSCAMCHAQPSILGSAPGLRSPQRPIPNPQLALATLHGADNAVPPFITADGPVRQARFKSDNDVHGLYTITGRSDARGCTQAQPDFASHLAKGNVSFRIPLALFGLGLVEAVSEAALHENLEANHSAALGIAGTFNRSSNDGTINRFGWKGQNKSILVFAGEAYNVEVGVTNELFPEERSAVRGCSFNGIPEDHSDPTKTGSVSDTNSDVQNFAFAVRLSAPPKPALHPKATQRSVDSGRGRFASTGCANCHTPELVTATSNLDLALSKVPIHPFSDFALHRMGSGLADGIVQGAAGPEHFRTTPLWGIGQRLFFLHDGRTSDLVEAIEAHASTGSEANAVVSNFNQLPITEQQDVVNFLRSL